MDWWKKKKKARAYDEKQRLVRGRERGAMLLEDLIECCDGNSNPIKFFSGDHIIKATNNFSKSNNVFSDTYGYNWYSGKNENHNIFFKTEELDPRQGIRFRRDIAISSMVSGHKNFLKLVGCCLETEEPAFVYHGVKKHYKLDIEEQSWKRRMKIAEDIAIALAYLHTAFPRPFVYRNMSLENILLDEDGVAKLSGFSCCVSIPQGETFVRVDGIVGVSRYMEHDYLINGVVSEKTDVFGIGIFMQQLLTGEERELWAESLEEDVEGEVDRGGKDVQETSESEGDCDSGYDSTPRYVFRGWLSKSMEEGRMEEIADPKMIEEMGEISEEELYQMKSFLMLSQRCIGLNGEVPTMMEVVKELKKIQRSVDYDEDTNVATKL